MLTELQGSTDPQALHLTALLQRTGCPRLLLDKGGKGPEGSGGGRSRRRGRIRKYAESGARELLRAFLLPCVVLAEVL